MTAYAWIYNQNNVGKWVFHLPQETTKLSILAHNLKCVREDADMTQKELGEKLGVSDRNISNYERGKVVIPLDTLIAFCKLFNRSLDDMVGHRLDGETVILRGVSKETKKLVCQIAMINREQNDAGYI